MKKNHIQSPESVALEVIEFIEGTSFKNDDEKRIRSNQRYMGVLGRSCIDYSDLIGYIKSNYPASMFEEIMACFTLTGNGNPKDNGFFVAIKPEVLKRIRNTT